MQQPPVDRDAMRKTWEARRKELGMRSLAYATKLNAGACRWLESALRQRVPVHIVEFGAPNGRKSGKFPAVHKGL